MLNPKEALSTTSVLFKTALFSAIITVFAYNITKSWILYSAQPLSDAAAYPALASQSGFFYDSGVREPVPVMVVKILSRRE